MNYVLPEYILKNVQENNVIDYVWDDSDITNTLNFDYSKEIVKRIEGISLRAKIALTIGVYEWTLARLGPFSNSLVPYQTAEAAWCANINKYYVYYMEFYHDDYIGPVDGALWYGFFSLISTVYVSDNITDVNNIDKYKYEDRQYFGGDNHQFAEIGLIQNIALTLHILPNVEPFKQWLETIIERFIQLYVMPEDDPFANLFGYKSEKDWLGDYVAIEALDPSYDYQQDKARELLTHFLMKVDYRSNPFLIPPEELENRIDEPYLFIPTL